MAAVKKATDYVLAEPDKAYADYVDMKPLMGTELNRKIFERSFAYFSKDLQNVKRDWVSPQPVLFPFFFSLSRLLPSRLTTSTGQGHQLRQAPRRAAGRLRAQLHQLVPGLEAGARVAGPACRPEAHGRPPSRHRGPRRLQALRCPREGCSVRLELGMHLPGHDCIPMKGKRAKFEFKSI